LHCGHLIPSLSLSIGENEELARSWIIALYGLVRASLDILRAPEEAVQQAFSWLADGGDAPEDGPEGAPQGHDSDDDAEAV
jgi:hypothetical protein